MRPLQKWQIFKKTIISKSNETRPIYRKYDSNCQNQSNQHTYWQIIGVRIFDKFCKRADWALLQKWQIFKKGQLYLNLVKLLQFIQNTKFSNETECISFSWNSSNQSKLRLKMPKPIEQPHLLAYILSLNFRWIL